METLSTLLACCKDSPHKGRAMQSFDVFLADEQTVELLMIWDIMNICDIIVMTCWCEIIMTFLKFSEPQPLLWKCSNFKVPSICNLAMGEWLCQMSLLTAVTLANQPWRSHLTDDNILATLWYKKCIFNSIFVIAVNSKISASSQREPIFWWALLLMSMLVWSLHWRHNERDDISKSPAAPVFTQTLVQAQIKENINAPRHWPLWGEFTGDRWIPHTKGQ